MTEDRDFEAQPPTAAEIASCPLAFAWALGAQYRGDEWGRKRYGAFHRRIVSEVRAHQRVSVVVPRGHAKTTLITHIMTAWEICRDVRGHHRILIASAGQGLAKQNVGKVREILEGPIEIGGVEVPLAAVFPWARPINPRGAVGDCASFKVVGRSGPGKEPSVFAGSINTSLAGRRFTLALLDDVVDEKNSNTREQREKAIAFLHQVEALRYDKAHTPIRMVSTNWVPGDLTDHIAGHPGYRQIKHDLYLDGETRRSRPGELRATVCPAFLDAEEANQMEMEAIAMGKYAFFCAQYRLAPMSGEAPMFTPELWTAAQRPLLAVSNILKAKSIRVVLLWDPVASLDPSAVQDRNGVAAVAVIPGTHPLVTWPLKDDRRNVFVPLFAGEIAGSADEALQQIEDWVGSARWPTLTAIWTEEVAAQSFLAPWAKERGRLDGVRVRGQKIPARSLTLRLAGLQTAMREGYFVVPEGCEGIATLRERLMNYPKADYDDLPAALCLLTHHWERRGALVDDAAEPPPRIPFERGGPGPQPPSQRPVVL